MINMEFSDNELDVIYDALQEMLISTDDDNLTDTILAIQERIYLLNRAEKE